MTSSEGPNYHAEYQRRLRAQARAKGYAQLNSIVPGDLVARLDAVKLARGLASRDEALVVVLREYFSRGAEERTLAVSP